MDPKRTTDDVNERRVWQTPVLRPLSAAVGARSGTSTGVYEGTAETTRFQYAPAPS